MRRTRIRADILVPGSPTLRGADVGATAREPGSFRDPSGFVYHQDGRLLRQVNRSFGTRWDDLSSSGLLAGLQARGLLVSHQPAPLDLALSPSSAHAVIEPQRIGFISYPYEWSFGELKDAALLTLETQAVASAAGFTLRDASAYNVQFHEAAPILIDTLSFERTKPNSPWVGYRQFCEHFLTPLALMAHRDVRCGLMLREFIDGIPVDFASTLLPGRTKLNVGLASHIHAHASAQRRHAGEAPRIAPQAARMSPLRSAALLDSLRRTVEGLSWHPSGTAWADYADNTSYQETAARSKDDLVREFLRHAGGNVVWDLGANAGRFSDIAASLGRDVIAWDTDQGATERHYQAIKRTGARSVLPLIVDLVNPSPGIGWANAERRSFLERSNADVVLALALIHHLAVGRNIPMPMIADLFAGLAPQIIVEYIPEADPMVQRLLATRVDVEPYPAIERFREIFSARFDIVDDAQIVGSERRLLRLARRQAPAGP